MGKSVKALDEASGVKTQNTAWFASDIAIDDTSKIRLNLALSLAVVVEITKDGTNWVTINSGNALGVDDESVFSIPVRNGDSFNIRTPTAGGVTVRYCRLDQIKDEG